MVINNIHFTQTRWLIIYNGEVLQKELQVSTYYKINISKKDEVDIGVNEHLAKTNHVFNQ